LFIVLAAVITIISVRGGQDLETAGAGHDDVEQRDVESILAQRHQRRRTVACLFNAHAVGFQAMP
jgi:hypothetical protein